MKENQKKKKMSKPFKKEQEIQIKQNAKDPVERHTKSRPDISEQQQEQKRFEEKPKTSERQTENESLKKHEEKYMYDPFEHVDNIADLTVENLKDHLFKDQNN